MQRTLECDICAHWYDTRARLPKSLLCGHGFCLVCMEDMVKNSAILCPKCRVKCDIPKGKISKLPTNFTILELLDTVCAECKDRPHAKRCQHCSENLCDECQRKHVRETKVDLESFGELIGRLMELRNESQETAKEIRSKGQSVTSDITRAHEAKMKQLEEVYQRQIAEVKSKVTEDLELQHDWDASLKRTLEKSKSLKENYQSSSQKVELLQTQYLETKFELQDIEHNKPTLTKICFDEMKSEFQLLLANYGRVDCSKGNKPSKIKAKYTRSVVAPHPPAVGDYTKAEFKSMVGKRGKAEGEFKNPRGVITGHIGEIIVADWLNDRLQILDTDLKVVRTISVEGVFDMCVLDGYIFVTQSNKRQIAVLSDRGEMIRTIGPQDTQLQDPRGITADKNGLLYICDPGERCIRVIKPTGEMVMQFGQETLVDVGPRYIASSKTKLYVSDNNYNLHTFSHKGKLLDTLRACSPPSNLRVTGIAVDAEDNLVLSDSMGRLVVMRDGGRLVTVVGTHGRGPGQLRGPEGVALGRGGELVVCDGGNDRVVIFTVPNV